jgi:hypothetical protein
MHWAEAVEVVAPHVVRISTPSGFGTGFLFTRAASDALVGIATAAHVISHAHAWEEPIKIEHLYSGTSFLARANDRAVILDSRLDTAALVLFRQPPLPVPVSPLPLIPVGMSLKVGFEIGWLGFPQVSFEHLCLFSGRVGAWLQSEGAYLVDGVAINGVSGGPAFHLSSDNKVVIIGIVSAYLPNRTASDVLPGLCIVQDVSQLHSLVQSFGTMDQAKQEQTPSVEALPPPSVPEPEGGA